MNIEVRHDQATEIRASARPTNLGAGLERLAQFADDVRSLHDALDHVSGLTGESTTKAVQRLSSNLAEFEPTITVLGQVKSGKTALVNAMAGWADLLPSDVNPWTSVVTSVHLKPGTERAEKGARFRFMTEDEWDRLLVKGGRMGELASRAGAESELQKIGEQIKMVRDKARKRLGKKFELLLGQEHDYGYFDKNLLERYICLGDDFDVDDPEPDSADQGRFADILRSAELFLNGLTVPYGICLRDTPGVNDTFMMREQITVQAIRDSRLCVVVLSASQALTSVDMGLIRLISNLESRNILFFVNRIDELSAPAEHIPEIEKSIRKTLQEKNGPEDAKIIFGSAYWANKVLSGDIEDMPEASKSALFDWANVALNAQNSEAHPNDLVWELSGLPALYRAISDRVVDDIGDPFVRKIASSAVTIATSQQAAGKVAIERNEVPSGMTTHETMAEFNRISSSQADALDRTLEKVIAAYHERADRAHAQFVERATQSLISHLEQHGSQVVWEYDPTGLRVLLRSAYSVFGARIQSQANENYETALMDMAELYSSAFGLAVEGIQISVPTVPDIPAPVSLGQTIALDFNDGWWTSWWSRIRGYEAFAKRFRQLISGETEDFMTQVKSVQTELIRKQTVSALSDFFVEQKDILLEISTGASQRGDLQNLFTPEEELRRADMIDDALEKLRSIAA